MEFHHRMEMFAQHEAIQIDGQTHKKYGSFSWNHNNNLTLPILSLRL